MNLETPAQQALRMAREAARTRNRYRDPTGRLSPSEKLEMARQICDVFAVAEVKEDGSIKCEASPSVEIAESTVGIIGSHGRDQLAPKGRCSLVVASGSRWHPRPFDEIVDRFIEDVMDELVDGLRGRPYVIAWVASPRGNGQLRGANCTVKEAFQFIGRGLRDQMDSDVHYLEYLSWEHDSLQQQYGG